MQVAESLSDGGGGGASLEERRGGKKYESGKRLGEGGRKGGEKERATTETSTWNQLKDWKHEGCCRFAQKYGERRRRVPLENPSFCQT